MEDTIKKSPTVWTPAKTVIVVSLILLVGESLIMVLLEIIHTTISDDLLENVLKFLDPIVLTGMVAPALYLLVLRPMNRQLVELHQFYKLTVGRELRMKRYTKPEKVHQLLLDQLGFTLPEQPPPEIQNPKPVVETF